MLEHPRMEPGGDKLNWPTFPIERLRPHLLIARCLPTEIDQTKAPFPVVLQVGSKRGYLKIDQDSQWDVRGVRVASVTSGLNDGDLLGDMDLGCGDPDAFVFPHRFRSEERRVGKEC